MLPQKFRLQKSKDIQYVIKHGRRARARLLQMTVGRRTAQELPTRFAFVVSNKISKKATVRNRMKRLMREAARTVLSKIDPGYDIIVWAQIAMKDKPLAEITQDLEHALRSIRILK